jgi:tetrahydromethanopterin S-methyltransferase subunit E
VKGINMTDLMRKFLASDGVRRALWTLAQAAVALVTVDALGLSPVYAVPVAAVLSALKTWIATKAAQ